MSSGCFTCALAEPTALRDELVLVETPLLRINQIESTGGYPGVDLGWTIVSPRRHVQNLRDLKDGEQQAMMAAAAILDDIFLSRFGAHRTLFSSLGWLVTDHVHAHAIPVMDAPGGITRGVELFDAYIPIRMPVSDYMTVMRHTLAAAFNAAPFAPEKELSYV